MTRPDLRIQVVRAGLSFECSSIFGFYWACAPPKTNPTSQTAPTSSMSAPRTRLDTSTQPRPLARFTVETTPPQTTIDSGPSGATNDRTPHLRLSSSQPARASVQARLRPSAACSPAKTTLAPDGRRPYLLRAGHRPVGNTDASPASATFTLRTASISVQAPPSSSPPPRGQGQPRDQPALRLGRAGNGPPLRRIHGLGRPRGSGLHPKRRLHRQLPGRRDHPGLPALVTSADQRRQGGELHRPPKLALRGRGARRSDRRARTGTF